MERKHKRNKSVYRIFWGVVFLLAGVAIILNLMGVLNTGPFSMGIGNLIWTIVLSLLVIWGVMHRFWFFIFFGIIAIWYVFRTGMYGYFIDSNTLWALAGAALLLTIGCSILFRKKKHFHDFNHKSCKVHITGDKDEMPENEKGNGIHTSASEDENNIFIKSSFGSSVKYVNIKALRHAYLDCSFGAIKAFFDDAEIDPTVNEAVIEIQNSCGGIELYLPKEWNIIDDVNRTLGGVNIKNSDREPGNGPTVRLIGDVKLGGVEIVLV